MYFLLVVHFNRIETCEKMHDPICYWNVLRCLEIDNIEVLMHKVVVD